MINKPDYFYLKKSLMLIDHNKISKKAWFQITRFNETNDFLNLSMSTIEELAVFYDQINNIYFSLCGKSLYNIFDIKHLVTQNDLHVKNTEISPFAGTNILKTNKTATKNIIIVPTKTEIRITNKGVTTLKELFVFYDFFMIKDVYDSPLNKLNVHSSIIKLLNEYKILTLRDVKDKVYDGTIAKIYIKCAGRMKTLLKNIRKVIYKYSKKGFRLKDVNINLQDNSISYKAKAE